VQYYWYSSVVLFAYLLLYMLVYMTKFNFRTYKFNLQASLVLKFYFLIAVGGIIFYYILFFMQFPVVHFIRTGQIIERPDLTGAIPFFFAMSSLAFIIIPSFYFYFFNAMNKIQHVLINTLIICILVLAGHKGIVVYYFIFIWLFVFKTKFNIKVLILFLLSLVIYLLTKGITEINSQVIEYLLTSPFRRIFVTQGGCFLHRVDMLNEGYSYLQANPRGIKFDVFDHMYNIDGVTGSCPTFFSGDLLVKYGNVVTLVLFIVVSYVVLLTSKASYYIRCDRKLFLYWNVYLSIYFIAMSGIGFSNIIRIVVIIANMVTIYWLGRIRVKH